MLKLIITGILLYIENSVLDSQKNKFRESWGEVLLQVCD